MPCSSKAELVKCLRKMDVQEQVEENKLSSPAKSATAQEEQPLPMADDTVERGPPRTAPGSEAVQPSLTMQQIIGAMSSVILRRWRPR